MNLISTLGLLTSHASAHYTFWIIKEVDRSNLSEDQVTEIGIVQKWLELSIHGQNLHILAFSHPRAST